MNPVELVGSKICVAPDPRSVGERVADQVGLHAGGDDWSFPAEDGGDREAGRLPALCRRDDEDRLPRLCGEAATVRSTDRQPSGSIGVQRSKVTPLGPARCRRLRPVPRSPKRTTTRSATSASRNAKHVAYSPTAPGMPVAVPDRPRSGGIIEAGREPRQHARQLAERCPAPSVPRDRGGSRHNRVDRSDDAEQDPESDEQRRLEDPIAAGWTRLASQSVAHAPVGVDDLRFSRAEAVLNEEAARARASIGRRQDRAWGAGAPRAP